MCKIFWKLIGSIKKTTVPIIVSILLMIIVFIIIQLGLFQSENQVEGFLVGIVASIIATLVLKISDKYVEGDRARVHILHKVRELVKYIDTEILTGNENELKQHKFILWKYYMELAERAEQLIWEDSFDPISIAVNEIVKSVYSEDVEMLKRAKKDLIIAKDKL